MFSGKTNIFPDNARKIIVQCNFFRKTIFSEHLEKENIFFRALCWDTKSDAKSFKSYEQFVQKTYCMKARKKRKYIRKENSHTNNNLHGKVHSAIKVVRSPNYFYSWMDLLCIFRILELRNRVTKTSYAKWRHTSNY